MLKFILDSRVSDFRGKNFMLIEGQKFSAHREASNSVPNIISKLNFVLIFKYITKLNEINLSTKLNFNLFS